MAEAAARIVQFTPAAAALPPRFVALAGVDRTGHPVPGARTALEAAVLFLEDWHPATAETGQVEVTVIDRDTGDEQRFQIDVE